MDYVAKFVESIIIQRNKAIESKIAIEIKEIACENGLETRIDLYEENVISALVKQIPRKPYTILEIFDNDYYCPNCDNSFFIDGKNYCSNCGQKLDWSDIYNA